MKRHLLSTTLLWAFALLPLAAAQDNVWDGTADTDWYTGHESDGSYIITTAKQLAGLAQLVNNGTQSFSGKTITLGVDIILNENVLSDDGTLNSGNFKAWTPIGTESYRFSGTFDGQGHTIRGVYINNNSDYQGLFGYINNGTVQNLTVTEIYIQGYGYVGGIVGWNYNNTILNCSNSGTVSGDKYVGGIAGDI